MSDEQFDFMADYPEPGYILVPEIQMYVHPEHIPFVEKVRAEITQDTGASAHGDLSTRVNYRCKGPLCQKAMRDWARAHRQTLAAREGRTVRTYPRLGILEQIDPMLRLLALYHKSKLYGLRVQDGKLAEQISA